jgi:Na+/H+-dicarboxylate symporter
MKRKKKKKTFFDYLLSPWAVIIGMGGGCFMGVYLKEFSDNTEIFGELFLAFLMSALSLL